MNGTQKIGVGLVILGALGFWAYKTSTSSDPITKASSDTQKVELTSAKAPDDLDKLVLQNADKPEIVLVKKAERPPGVAAPEGDAGEEGYWYLSKPVEAPANQAKVKSLLENLKDVKTTGVLEPEATDEVKKSNQVDPSKGVHVVGYHGADKKVDDTFGKTGKRGTAVAIGGKPALFLVDGYSSFHYTGEPKSYRDQSVFDFKDELVNQITLVKKGGDSFSFTKGDKWAGTFKGKPIERFDEDKVKDLLRTFKSLSADDFGDGKAPSDTGLDEPDATLTFSLKDGAGTYVLKVGKASSGSSRYAEKNGNPTIYVLGSTASDWAVAGPDKFQKLLDGGTAKPASPPMGMGGMPPGMGGGMDPDEMPPGHP